MATKKNFEEYQRSTPKSFEKVLILGDTREEMPARRIFTHTDYAGDEYR